MKTIKNILIIILVLIIGFAIYVGTRPSEFNFERSLTIKAPAEVLYDKVNNFKNWPEFSPWLEQDPNAALSYGNTTQGVGSSYSWAGDILGEGSMETTKTIKNQSIAQKINFIKPFEASSNINWTFDAQGAETKVTWQMNGDQDFVSKLFTVFMGSIEENTGPDFERGLFKLDSIVQRDMRVYSIKVNGMAEHSGGYYLYKTTSCKFADFQDKMASMMPEIGAYAISNNISFAGRPFVLYQKWDEANDAIIFSTCIPTTTRIISKEPDILTGQLEPFKAIRTTLIGDYSNLKETWETTMSYIESNNHKMDDSGPMIEIYIKDHSYSSNPAKWVTDVFVPIK